MDEAEKESYETEAGDPSVCLSSLHLGLGIWVDDGPADEREEEEYACREPTNFLVAYLFYQRASIHNMVFLLQNLLFKI